RREDGGGVELRVGGGERRGERHALERAVDLHRELCRARRVALEREAGAHVERRLFRDARVGAQHAPGCGRRLELEEPVAPAGTGAESDVAKGRWRAAVADEIE